TEIADGENTLIVVYNGPYYVRGDLDIEGAADDMPGVKYRAALCRCGLSKNKPFCDNSHEGGKFQDYGAVGEQGEGLVESGGKLSVSLMPDGPLILEGNLTIIAGSGRKAWQGTNVALCRCGASANKPFCDGSHTAAGFKG
ncbi:MAG: CDGSH iron-sulfur domain-containing protein, partial [Halobacteria archaeon]|nr:CDGSH iron-sulfur domain-containing protein [Halobacteria archaeon]